MSSPCPHQPAAIAFGVAIGLSLLSPASGDWPMFRHDAGRSGLAEGDVPTLAGLVWSVELDGPVDTSPAVVGGRVVAGTTAGTLYGLDSGTGDVAWQTAVGCPIVSSPCIVGQMVVFGGVDGYIRAVDLAGGEERWRARTERAITAPPVAVADTVICGSTDGRLYALRADTGEVVWRTEPGGEIHAGPAIAGDRVLYADVEGRVRCVSLADGASLWERAFVADGPVFASPVVAGDVAAVSSAARTALTPQDSANIHCIDVMTGKRVWGARGRNVWATEKEKGFSVTTCPTVVADAIWFVTQESYGNWSATLRSAGLADGSRGLALKKRAAGAAIAPSDSSPAVAGGVLHLVDYTGALYQVDGAQRRVGASFDLGARTRSSPAISDGDVYIGLTDGRLVCVQ